MPTAPQFSKQDLHQLQLQLEVLQHQLADLQAELSAAAGDAAVEPQLAATNQSIHTIRRQWRSLLQLPAGK